MAEWLPFFAVAGLVIGMCTASAFFLTTAVIRCQTAANNPCSDERIQELNQQKQLRLLFAQTNWSALFGQQGYSPKPLQVTKQLPYTISLIVPEEIPVYQLKSLDTIFSVTTAGKVTMADSPSTTKYLFNLNNPTLLAEITAANTVPPETHAELLMMIRKLSSLPLTFESLEVLPDAILAISVTPNLTGLVSLNDLSSLDRLAVLVHSNQLTLDKDQQYEVDARFIHPVLRKRL